MGSVSKYLESKGSKGFFSTLADTIAFVLQTAGIITSFFLKHLGRSQSAYILPLALVLSSLRWWPNYVATDENPSNISIFLNLYCIFKQISQSKFNISYLFNL